MMLAGCGIKHKNRHSCRHTHASMMVDNGATLPKLMKSIGWRSTKVALGYINTDDNEIENLVTGLPSPKNQDFYLSETKKNILKVLLLMVN